MNPSHETLLLGVDGGGTKTAACLARLVGGSWVEVGRGHAGPSNVRAVGQPRATEALLQAIAECYASANIPQRPADSAVLALAGVGQPALQQQIQQWAQACHLAHQLSVVHDAWPVLRAAAAATANPSANQVTPRKRLAAKWTRPTTPTGSPAGLALIVGTGSMAFGCDVRGNSARAGGWGYLFGDEGSAFDLGVMVMRAVTWADDGRGPPTQLTALLLEQEREQGRSVPEFASSIYQAPDPRQRLASLARCLLAGVAARDAVAVDILHQAAQQWRRQILAVLARLRWPTDHVVPLALTGGILVQAPPAQEALLTALQEDADWQFATPVVVERPVVGSVWMAFDQWQTAQAAS